jgi:hypothetical protein
MAGRLATLGLAVAIGAFGFSGTARDDDRSVGALTRDRTKDGAGTSTRDRTANDTNDRSRNDTR